MTLDKLRKSDKLKYIDNHLVTTFKQEDDKVVIQALDLKTKDVVEFSANKFLIGAGSLGNARIILRSLKQIDRLPLLCNPYVYMPCINISMLGKPLSQYKTSLAQALMLYDPDKTNSNLVTVALFTYRSLLLQRLVGMTPFGYSSGLKLLKYLQSAFIIAGIHHPDQPSDTKYLSLVSNSSSPTSDMLYIHYSLGPHEIRNIHLHEKAIKKTLRKLGCYSIKRIDPGFGGSIHYGGTIPFSDLNEPGTQLSNGSLFGNDKVFILDASGFAFLPAKGVTLSIMANAHRVTVNAMNSGR